MCACHWTPDAVWKLSGVITRSVRRGRKHSVLELRTAVSLWVSFTPACATVWVRARPIDVSDKAESRGEVRGNSSPSLKMEPTVRTSPRRETDFHGQRAGRCYGSVLGGGCFVKFTKDKRFKLRLSDWSCDPARTVRIQSPFEVCHELGSLSHGDGWTLTWTLGLEGSLHKVNRRGTVRGTRNFKNKGCNNSQNNKWCLLVLVYILYFQSAKMLHLFFFF